MRGCILLGLFGVWLGSSALGQCPTSYQVIGNPKCLCIETLSPPATMPGSILYTANGFSQTFFLTSGGNCPTGTTPYTTNNCNGALKEPTTDATLGGFSSECNYSAGILPVTIIDFGVTLQGPGLMIYWMVAEEMGIDHYKIEHSLDGIDFSEIGEMASNYDGHGGLYEFNSNQFGPGMHYFRLRIIEVDGSVALSAIQDVKLDFKQSAVLYPTLAIDRVTLQWSPGEMDVQRITLHDVYGRLIWSSISIDESIQEIDVSDIPAGSYFVNLVSKGGYSKLLRFVKL